VSCNGSANTQELKLVKASDLFVKCLEAEGIEYIFGVPGEENADFMLSLEASTQITFILTRHEQGAAFMAEAYGRLTGNPAGCLGTLGPGATNLLTGVADANMDRAPMLVLTGQGATTRLHKESHQIMDVVAMFEPVTKWATTILDADTIPEITRKAVRVARGEKPGAVHIELPEDIAKEESSKTPLTPRRYRRSVPDVTVVDKAFEMIRAAKRPIVIAGNGCIRRRASAQLRKLCEMTGIGVLTTFMAKGAVDPGASYSLFTIGLGAKDRANYAIDDSDLVITLGVDMVEYHPSLWNGAGAKKIIHADFIPAEIDENYLPEVELIGDLAQTLEMLNERLGRLESLPEFDLDGQRKVRNAVLADFSEYANDTARDRIRPQKVLWDVARALNPEDVVLSDVGAHKMWIARYLNRHEPNTCLIPNGFCAMGFALPGAIGAHLVDPSRRILAISGDAGFLMNVQEMETARRLNSNIVAMVWEDHAYGLIEWKQQNQFGRNTELSFGNPDWLGLAAAFGWDGQYIDASDEVLPALERALNHQGPSLLVLPIDYRENQILTRKLGDLSCAS
jgi:acetolactate synthase-1/2/3 large subunit